MHSPSAEARSSIVQRTASDGTGAEINNYYGSEAERAQRGQYGIPSATNTGRFQYTGQVYLSELGMYYYKARIYSPTLGRFLQTDPIGYEDNVNLYGYVANDPINLVDFDGKQISGVERAIERDNRELLEGKITEEEWRERQMARGAGAAAGAGFWAVAIATRGFGIPSAIGWFARGSFQSAKGYIGARFAVGEATKGRTTQFIGSGGRQAAEGLFRTLTNAGKKALDQGRTVVGRLRDGSNVNIRTRTLEGGIKRTTVEVQRARTGSRIPERIKVRFDEKIPE